MDVIVFIISFYMFELCFVLYKIGVGGESFGLGIQRLGLQCEKEKVTEARWGDKDSMTVNSMFPDHLM